MKIYKVFVIFFIIVGWIFSGIFFHELYHYLDNKETTTEICFLNIDFGKSNSSTSNDLGYVLGNELAVAVSRKEEIIAHSITIIIFLIGGYCTYKTYIFLNYPIQSIINLKNGSKHNNTNV